MATTRHPIAARRSVAVLLVTIAASVGLAITAAPAAAAAAAPAAAAGRHAAPPVGYVRLAHLSPDTPPVDVYLSKIGDSSFVEQKFASVGYGVMSKYLPLPQGTYAVAMRSQGAPYSAKPVLTTQVTVDAGGAYTVAGVGKFASLGLEILVDDLSRPAAGQAKVRVIQASVAAPVMDVTLPNGVPIANAVTFASTTAYQLVEPGTWSLKLKPTGSATVTSVSAYLAGGSVYSLLVLDGANGLKVEVRTDARGSELVPDGGVETGAGGTAWDYPRALLWTGLGLGAALVVVLLVLGVRLRRLGRAAARS